MATRDVIDDQRTIEGTLHRLDLVNRMITLRTGDDVVSYDVPVSCDILLNGQRVKMHVLQVNDPVLVTYRSHSTNRRASRIHVHSTHLALRRR
jgi:hypothetical protein